MRAKLTNEEVDRRLEGSGIKRIGEYTTSNQKIKVKCLKDSCGCEWDTKIGNIFFGNGCPRCAGREKLTNEIVDKRLEGRNIKRLDDVKGSLIKIKWQCLIEMTKKSHFL